MENRMKSNYKLYALALLCTLLWGSAIPTIKIGYSLFRILPEASADQVLFAGIRFSGAGLLLLIPCALSPKRALVNGQLMRHSLVIGLIQTAGQYFFMYIGLGYTTSVNTSVFNAIGTLLYIVLAWVIFRDEKVSPIKLAGCIVGFAGILLNSLATQRMGTFSLKGDGMIILANICVAAGFLYSKYSLKNSDPILLTGLQMTIGGLTLLVTGLLLGGRLPTMTAGGVGVLLYLMMVSSVAFSIWTLLMKKYSAALVGMFNFFTPVFGTVFSYFFSRWHLIDEAASFTLYSVIAIVCSAGGIFLSSLGNVMAEKQQTK